MEELRQSPADNLIRALALVRSIERNLRPIQSQHPVLATQADVLDQALDLLEQIGEDVELFRYPKKEIIVTDRVGKRFVDRDLLYGKVTALIDYFAIRQAVLDLAEEMKQVPQRMIGFKSHS
jgi:hypothetical protein